jgi:hypothetical protein
VAGPRVSLGYFSLHEQREVTRSSAGRVKARDLALTGYFSLHEQRKGDSLVERASESS